MDDVYLLGEEVEEEVGSRKWKEVKEKEVGSKTLTGTGQQEGQQEVRKWGQRRSDPIFFQQ